MRTTDAPRLLDRPPIGEWFVLDVMRKGPGGARCSEWVALMIDVDPDIFCTADVRPRSQHCCVDLGKHKDRDSAWDYAEQLTATRH